jgi:hypothetical protein
VRAVPDFPPPECSYTGARFARFYFHWTGTFPAFRSVLINVAVGCRRDHHCRRPRDGRVRWDALTAIGTLSLAVMTLAAVITTIVITAQDRGRADAALERASRREDETWRLALHVECRLNISLGQEHPGGLWSFDTGVLRDCTAHASAFSAEVLQRIIWARTADEQLEAMLATLRAGNAVLGSSRTLKELQERVLGEISEIEKQLRPLVASGGT